MAFGSLIPPAFRTLVHQWRASREPVFPTYDAAVQSSGRDYNDTELANLVLRKTKAFVQTDVAKNICDHQAMCTLVAINTAAAACQRGTKPLRVLDFGGALGTSYYLAKALMPGAYQWAVVESAVFADAARGLGQDTSELRVFPSISEAMGWLGGVDLLYSSSTLQYLPDADPFLDELPAPRPACVAWLRTAFSLTDKVVVLQQSRPHRQRPGPGAHGRQGPARLLPAQLPFAARFPGPLQGRLSPGDPVRRWNAGNENWRPDNHHGRFLSIPLSPEQMSGQQYLKPVAPIDPAPSKSYPIRQLGRVAVGLT